MKNTPALVWPRLLELPSEDVTLVYLDINHWISFAQASTGHSSGVSFVQTLEACRAAKSAGTAVFVLSAIHYMEMNKIKDPSQRRAIADVMEDLTGFASLMDRVVVMNLELDAMLDRFAQQPSLLSRILLLGRGVRHSFGRNSGVKFVGRHGNATEEVRAHMGARAFDDFVAEAELSLDRSVLRGPADDEVEGLRALGWKPESAIQAAEKRAAQERELSSILEKELRWRRGRLRDVIAARELCIEFEDILPRALARRQLALSGVISEVESSRRFVRAMPSTDVSIELKTSWHRNRDKNWAANDIYDIDAMSLAVPYCDIVVTEKACHHALTVARVGERKLLIVLKNRAFNPGRNQQHRMMRSASGYCADIVVAHRQPHSPAKPFVHDRLVIELPENHAFTIVGVLDPYPHPLALAGAVFLEFDFHLVARLIPRHSSLPSTPR
jgi:hypothetical protein